MHYAIFIDKMGSNHSAYEPDLPGCVASGDIVADVGTEIRDAIRFPIEWVRVDGIPVPALGGPTSDTVDLSAS